MYMLHKLLAAICIVAITACTSPITKRQYYPGQEVSQIDLRNLRNTSQFYHEALQENPVNTAKLNLFFTQMPKGGDLHHHYSGSLYAETYLDWVAQDSDLRIDQCTLRIIDSTQHMSTKKCPHLTVEQLLKDNDSYRKLLSLWSNKDYSNHYHDQSAPDTSFFNTFSYFGPVSGEYSNMPSGLNILKQRALAENVGYIETMLSTVKGVNSHVFLTTDEINTSTSLLNQASNQKEVNAALDSILAVLDTAKLNKIIDSFVNNVTDAHSGIDCTACNGDSNKNFMMRYQTYAARTMGPIDVFLDLYAGYLAAESSNLIVGVNIVAPENNYIALRDYTLHMQMFNYLSNKFNKVNRALHAGELTVGMVRPKNLNFHINQAVNIAGAQRIGHGVDIPYEEGAIELIKSMKEKNTVVEINLTSNQFILGVEKGEHPYPLYATNKVPLIISTDDSGVSRNNLSHEYMLLASRYKPDYGTLKSYVYNSIKYSFMSALDKEKQLEILDTRFSEFESKVSNLIE